MATTPSQKFAAVVNKTFARVPVLNTPDEPIIRNAQDFIPIADIVDDIVLFKDGGAAIVLESTSLNFGLLSEREQEAVIAAYAALINSLSFATQIVIRTQRKNIAKYLAQLDEKMNSIENVKLKDLMASYKGFISDTIKKRNVLGKRFFVVIPFSPLELGFSKSLFPGQQKREIPYTKTYVLKKAKTILLPKRDHLIRQASRLGLKLTQLDRPTLIDLYYDIHNPDIEAVRERETVKEE